MRGLKLLIIGVLCSFWSQSASAGWEDISDDKACSIANTWELGTSIIIQKRKDDTIMDDDYIIGIFNDNWSLSRETEVDFDLKLEASDGSWLANMPVAVDRGLVLNTKKEYLDNFRYVSGVSVLKGEEEIAVLQWGLFSLAWRELDRCVAKMRAPILEAERRKRVEEAVPRDPFATAKTLNEAEAERTKPD